MIIIIIVNSSSSSCEIIFFNHKQGSNWLKLFLLAFSVLYLENDFIFGTPDPILHLEHLLTPFQALQSLIQPQLETRSLWKTLAVKKIPHIGYLVFTSISSELVGWPQVHFASCWRILLQRSFTTAHNADKKIQKWVYEWWQSLPSEACDRKASGVIRWSWGMERRHGKGSFGTCFHGLITLSKTFKNI